MARKEELLTSIKAICRNAGFRPKFYESLQPDRQGRTVISVAAGIYLEDEHDDAIDQLNALTWGDKEYVVEPSGNIHFGGTPEQSGMKQIY